MGCKDYFSSVSPSYASYRPKYPTALFDWLAGISPSQKLAWDCACGTGQATSSLARCFDRVIGTDASEAQIKAASGDESRIEWRVAPAEQSGIESNSVDLITVAQALHWFDLPRFYAESNRVLRPGGILAAWSYGLNEVEGEGLDGQVRHFYSEVVGPYWPPERAIVEAGYRTLPFPFLELKPPSFEMEAHWKLDEFLGYLSTWSATSRYKASTGVDPIPALRANLLPLWGEPGQPRRITWPLSLRVGAAHRDDS